MATPAINQDNIRYALKAMEQLEAGLQRFQYVTYLPHAYSLIRGLFYPAEALALLAHQFSTSHVTQGARDLYEENVGRLKPYNIDYRTVFKVVCTVTEKVYPDWLGSLLMTKEKLIDSGILEELEKEEDKPLKTWIQELKESKQTLGEYRKAHPIATKVLGLLFKQTEYATLDQIRLEAFVRIPAVRDALLILEEFSFSPAKVAKGITSWKWEFEDPNALQWLCTKVVLNTFLVVPLAYAAKETWSIMIGRKVSIGYSSLMKQVFIGSFVGAVTENIAAYTLKTLDSRMD